jgi:hypothetical protein
MLGGFFLVFLGVSYNLAFKKTIDLRNECNQIEKQIQTANDAPLKIQELKKEKEQIDKVVGKETNNRELQQSLLGIITRYCKDNNLILDDFPKPELSRDGGVTLETNTFIIEGAFNKLLQLEYLFEQKLKIGKIASVHYKAKRNYDTKKYTLTVTIFIQNIKSGSHEA